MQEEEKKQTLNLAGMSDEESEEYRVVSYQTVKEGGKVSERKKRKREEIHEIIQDPEINHVLNDVANAVIERRLNTKKRLLAKIATKIRKEKHWGHEREKIEKKLVNILKEHDEEAVRSKLDDAFFKQTRESLKKDIDSKAKLLRNLLEKKIKSVDPGDMYTDAFYDGKHS